MAGGGPDPQGGEYYHSIRLLEVVWKAVMVIINCHFTASISFHIILYGTGTASLEVKLPQQLTSMREEVRYAIFLDLHKA